MRPYAVSPGATMMQVKSRVPKEAAYVNKVYANALIDPHGSHPCRVNAGDVPQPTCVFKGIEEKIVQYQGVWDETNKTSFFEGIRTSSVTQYFTGVLGAGGVLLGGFQEIFGDTNSIGQEKGESYAVMWPGADGSIWRTIGTRIPIIQNTLSVKVDPNSIDPPVITTLSGAPNTIPIVEEYPRVYEGAGVFYAGNRLAIKGNPGERLLMPRNIGDWDNPEYIYEISTMVGVNAGDGGTSISKAVGFTHRWSVAIEAVNGAKGFGAEGQGATDASTVDRPSSDNYSGVDGTVNIEYRNQANNQWTSGGALVVRGATTHYVNCGGLVRGTNSTGMFAQGEWGSIAALGEGDAILFNAVRVSFNPGQFSRNTKFKLTCALISNQAEVIGFDGGPPGTSPKDFLNYTLQSGRTAMAMQVEDFSAINSKALNQVQTSRGTAYSIMQTYFGSSLRNGGQCSGAQLAPGIGIEDLSNGDILNGLREIPEKGGSGALMKGQYLKWVPDGLKALDFVSSGTTNLATGALAMCMQSDDKTQGSKLQMCAHIEGTTTSQQYELGYADPGHNIAYTVVAVRGLTPPWTCNPDHKGIKSFFNRVWGNFKKGIQSKEFWQGAWNIAKQVAPTIGAALMAV